MKTHSKQWTKHALMMMLMMMTVFLISGTIYATVRPLITISGSNLSGGSITFNPFSPLTLNGSLQTSTANWSIANVIDARGNGNGWNLTLTLTQMSEFNPATASYVSGGQTLPWQSIKVMTAPTGTQVDTTSSPASDLTTVAVNSPLDTGFPVKIISAPKIKGMGSYSFTNLVTSITVPANAFAVSYASDAIISLSTGP